MNFLKFNLKLYINKMTDNSISPAISQQRLQRHHPQNLGKREVKICQSTACDELFLMEGNYPYTKPATIACST